MVRAARAVTFALLLAACGSSPTAPESASLSELTSAPTRVVSGGRELALSSSLWRDFMPPVPAEGRPLVAVLQVKTTDGSVVPADVTADTAWIVYGAEVWSSVLEPRPRADTSPVYELVARNGPKWGPGVTVDVVVRLRDSAGRVALLRAPAQAITATY